VPFGCCAELFVRDNRSTIKMAREDRFYAFIIAHSSRSRARVQRIRVEKRSVTIFCAVLLLVSVGLFYGLYGLTQQAAHLRTEFENQRLRAENERQRQELEKLNNRVEKVEDTSRKLAEKSGVVDDGVMPGTGGPALPLDEMGLATLTAKTNRLEEDLRSYEAILRERGYTPTVWPVDGTLEGGFGGRRNPFGGPGWEFHSGQDIEAPWGAPVVAGASGTVSFVGWQNGYGQLVIVDHGGGLSTRYGHLSHIDVELNQTVSRAQLLGKVGSTGRSTGPHLHYEVRINDQPVNPLQYLLLSTKSAAGSASN
jgi:murein DD-endopeptidase MepM/ murein hydrolase activator NlpD